ncbi:YueH family protein [Salinicoccus sp. HZC-1]|uniref:YueH family protein n=1 Tax=Salinicoccus sp. HZC-1 TaxID=3385497 RepID=UPI00398BA52C
MLKTGIDISGEHAVAYIYNNDDETHIISIPYINFSLELDRTLSRETREDAIIAHLFHMMDEETCEDIAAAITEVTDKQ